MIDENLAGTANALLYAAMAVYALAMVAFAVDLATVSRRAPVQAQPARQPVGAGAPATAIDLGDDVPAAPGTSVRRKAAGAAMALTYLATAAHVGSVVVRAIATQRAPWGNMFEYATAGSAVVTVVWLLLASRRDLRWLGVFVVTPVLITLGLALTAFYTEAAELVPALEDVWLIIHVSIAIVSTALFTIAFSTTVLQLVQERRELAAAAGSERRARWMDVMPDAKGLDQLTYRLVVIAFPLWTFTLVAGAIWAQEAWGRYWGWDPKEVWTFVIWVVYASYLHAKATRGWDGRKAAYLAAAGYACILVNFLVVNIFFVGLHSYA